MMPYQEDTNPVMAGGALKFEKALENLEEIVSSLEAGDLELEKSLKIFEEGIKMARTCQSHLNEAEKKIEKLIKDNKGKISTKPLEEGADDKDGPGQDNLPF